MRRRALLLLLTTGGCDAERSPALGLSRALLAVAGQSGVDESRMAESAVEIARLVAVAKRELAAHPARSPAATLSALFFEQWGFVREVEDTRLRHVLLPSVLEHRRGSCVGLGSLFLAVAEGVGLPAAGVLMPGHFYVRAREPSGARTIELLRRGEEMSGEWYERRFPVPGGAAREYARPLTASEVLGVVHYNVGNERRRQQRWSEADAAFTRAAHAFPELSEAHASLGAVQQLLGQLAAAQASYRRARDANPHLPGIEQNLALLEAERAAAK